MKRAVHRIKTSRRRGELIVTEQPDHIAVRLTFDRYGELGDEADVLRQLWPVLSRFDSDPRPIRFHSPDLGQHAVIDEVDGVGFALVEEEQRH